MATDLPGGTQQQYRVALQAIPHTPTERLRRDVAKGLTDFNRHQVATIEAKRKALERQEADEEEQRKREDENEKFWEAEQQRRREKKDRKCRERNEKQERKMRATDERRERGETWVLRWKMRLRTWIGQMMQSAKRNKVSSQMENVSGP